MKPKKPSKVDGGGDLTCLVCKQSASVTATLQLGRTLPWMIECRKILGGCGRWFDCTEATATSGGLV